MVLMEVSISEFFVSKVREYCLLNGAMLGVSLLWGRRLWYKSLGGGKGC
jgi:hypothetical protein